MKYFRQALSIISHGILGAVVFFIASVSASIYFSSLLDPSRECPGTDAAVAVNAQGDQVRMKSQTCGLIPRVKTVSLYVRGKDGQKYGPFLAYVPDGAVPRIAWTAQHGIAVNLASARNILRIGTLADFAIDYDVGQVKQ